MNLRPDEISSVIKEHIKDYKSQLDVTDFGSVIQVGDGIARVYGLDNCMAGELLQFGDDTFGMAQNLEEDNVGAVILGSDRNIKLTTLDDLEIFKAYISMKKDAWLKR